MKQCQENITHKKFLCFNAYIPENHDWIYIDKERRMCKKCNRNELFFGISSAGGVSTENWREVISNKE